MRRWLEQHGVAYVMAIRRVLRGESLHAQGAAIKPTVIIPLLRGLNERSPVSTQ